MAGYGHVSRIGRQTYTDGGGTYPALRCNPLSNPGSLSNRYDNWFAISGGPGTGQQPNRMWWDPGEDGNFLPTIFMTDSSGRWFWKNSNYTRANQWYLPEYSYVNELWVVVADYEQYPNDYSSWPFIWSYWGEWHGWNYTYRQLSV